MAQYNSKHGLPEVGSRHQNNAGKWYTIIEANNCKDILVRFDERGYEKRTVSHYVRSGCIAMPTYFVGDVVKDKEGVDVVIVGIETTSKITFQWPDGITRVAQSSTIGSGKLIHPEQSRILNPSIKVGHRFQTWQGCWAEVVKYENSTKITIKFLEPVEYEFITTQGNISTGKIRNKYAPSVCGIGVIGDATVENGKKDYRTWCQMMNRVYNDAKLEAHPIYKGCSVHSDWHQFGNFQSWINAQQMEGDWHLDKDLIKPGNKQYSAETCVMLPQELNTFLTLRRNHRGPWPVGVTYHERLGKWQATCSTGGHKISEYLGVFHSPEAAFSVYKARKEAYAKELAAKWQSKIDPRAYTALMNYVVNITD